MSYPPIRNQATYPGAGDVDDCWVVATVWAATAFDPSVRQPTVPEFRKHAGDPDDGHLDGGSLAEVTRGARGSWADIATVSYDGPWSGFATRVKGGRSASLAVLSSKLPAHLRFGFRFAHQVGVVWDGKTFLLANPLAPSGSQPKPITEAALKAAATALPYGGNVRALLFPPRLPDTSTEEAMQLTSKGPVIGTALVITDDLDGGWRCWRVRDGKAVPIAKGTRAEVRGIVTYNKSDEAPAGYTGYLILRDGEDHVLPSDRVSTFTVKGGN